MKEYPIIIALQDFMECELHAQQERYSTRSERFRAAAQDAHANWRLGCITLRPDPWRVQAVFVEGIKDIAALRLRLAYMPLFEGLERIEQRVGILSDLRREPWASPTHPVNKVPA